MFDSSMQAEVKAALSDVIGDNQISITIRRKVHGRDTALSAQNVRVERTGGRGVRVISESMDVLKGAIIVVGDTTLDIQKGDRFNLPTGELCQVSGVRPNKQVMIQAEADIIN